MLPYTEMRIYRGIIFAAPHGTYTVQGLKKMTIRTWHSTKVLNKPLLLVEKKKALGYIKLASVIEIHGIREFDKLYNLHRITPVERKLWWSGYKVYYGYKIVPIRFFKTPRQIQYPTGPQVFIKPENIRFVKK